MKVNSVFILVFIVMSVTACRNDKGPLPEEKAMGACDTIRYFVDDINPVISSNCASPGCHVPGAQLPDLSNYTSIKNNIDRVKVRTLDERTMPPAGSPTLSNLELSKLDCWIKQGYPNNAKDPAKAAANNCTATISYSLTIAPIISANCSSIACHGAGTSNSVDYSTYSGVQPDAQSGVLYDRMITQNGLHQAPVVINPPLTADQLNKISCWIQQGALNN